jgi:alpha-beta hydrolase superfamily lysophospholipase
MSRKRLPTPAGPAEQGVHDGLAYTLWLPEAPPLGGIVILHGAGSRKENHHDVARGARDAGFAALCFDARGHGASDGRLDARALADVAGMATLVPRPLVLRGSSMGGFLAIAAAETAGAAAVVAVCPAGAHHLREGITSGRLDFPADVPALEALLAEHDLFDVVERSAIPLMLLHAEGDEQIPFEHSVELHERSAARLKKLIVVPGGHHRSVQHDAELQGLALRFVRQALDGAP